MHDRHDNKAGATSERPTDEVLLAALRRAALHDPRGRDRAPIWALLEHLDVPRRSATARLCRERLLVLERRGWLERSSAHGVPMWALTRTGAKHLKRTRAPIVLPESPQHRTWQAARTLATQEIGRFAERLRETTTEAARLLQVDREGTISSDEWLELSARLAQDVGRLASARHCLSEWPEPDDAKADVDRLSSPGDELLDHDRLRALRVLRAGRRNTRLWREPD